MNPIVRGRTLRAFWQTEIPLQCSGIFAFLKIFRSLQRLRRLVDWKQEDFQRPEDFYVAQRLQRNRRINGC